MKVKEIILIGENGEKKRIKLEEDKLEKKPKDMKEFDKYWNSY